ncbi:hypothetical protein JOQ06_007546 [Pogonophryne albipinna]|uniref:Transposable element P transposase-like RNase H domain-containing protein n=1 Tax=Pogonophryne albipinna TaxID=1090488 RepID=A0AAD6FIJ6_9TELE|nr:hypothetical protein JOQ06_007546 [Pogonophryne albipinna]
MPEHCAAYCCANRRTIANRGRGITFHKWLCSVDGKPGLNKMMLDMLERRCQEDQAKYGCVALMLDAMAIRKHVQYNPHNQSMSGFVDMGDGNNETDVATEALVFMVVGLQGHWKAPIAYYLTKSLSPETQRVLLSHALEELHARGIRVVSVTMDGHASNVSMCNQLGCELKGNPQEPLKTSFPHPSTGDKVFVMMDACHMLKLARNMLQVAGSVREATGYTATFRHTISVEEGGEEGDCLHIRKGYHHVIEGFPNCVVADAVINFFMGRTDKVQQVGFNPRLARQAHLEFFIDGLGSLHIGSCSDIIVNHASKIQLPWTKTESQKTYDKFRYSPSSNDNNIHQEVFYFKNRFKCETSK